MQPSQSPVTSSATHVGCWASSSVTDTAHSSALNAIAQAKRYGHLVVQAVNALLAFGFCRVIAQYAINFFRGVTRLRGPYFGSEMAEVNRKTSRRFTPN